MMTVRVLGLALWLSCVSSAVINNDLYRLDIVHFNDFHDRFEETTVQFPVCKTNDDACIGGFARLYFEIKKLLSEKQNPLLLNAGDVFQGTYWYTLLKWDVEQKFMNLMPVDATALGNHEFDDGPAGLAPYLAALRSPVVAANLDSTNETALNGLYKPHIVVEKNGRKIGIIGLITTDTAKTSNPGKNLKFLDPIETVKKEAQLLTDEGVDIIIVLSHCGLLLDLKMAKEVGENIDIIVGGHSHSLLWNGTSPSKEVVSGTYPELVEADNLPGHKVVVVTASAFSKYLGNLTTYFDRKGNLQSFEASPVFLNRSIPEDQEIKGLLKPYKESLDRIVNEVLGTATDLLWDTPCGSRECALGDLVTDGMRAKAMESVNSTLPHVAFIQRNMLRGSISKGDITRGGIMNMLPFTNKFWTMELQGKYIVEFLQKCLTSSWGTDPWSGPWMPQISGMQVTLNTTDQSVGQVLVKEGQEFVPLKEDKYYQVTTMHFIVMGGNGFNMFLNNTRNLVNLGVDAKLFESYVKEVSPITPKLDNRLTVLS
ncbi:apyrase-like [Ostrinia furnacalis]|uniref:apyrase-like n=1 Tax=Ostrinia furnacalis TaxID=93504 RepID=UPI00103DB386|nr:apyrase-like [Ostrinia furnacalis]